MACGRIWLKDFDNTFLFGGESMDKILIKLNGVGEDYDSAFLKQQLGLKYMFEKNNNYDWYSICGCDTVYFKNNILKALRRYDKDSDVLLGETYNHTCTIDGMTFNLFLGGGGFFLSNSLMRKLYNLIDDFNLYWYNLCANKQVPDHIKYAHGDVAIAYMVKKYFNVNVSHLNGLFAHPPEFYCRGGVPDYVEKSSLRYVNKPLSYHYIKPHNMKSVYKKFTKK